MGIGFVACDRVRFRSHVTTPLRDAAMAGDAARFGRAYDEYAPVVYALLLRILQNAEDAQEVLQETFLAAWANAAGYDATRGSELGWLITMGRSRGIDRLRSRKRRSDREEEAAREISRVTPSVVPAGVDSLAISEARSAVRKALGDLPPAQRAALELAYFEGLSQSQIATKLGEPLGTIKTRMLLGMKRLRESLGAFGRR